MCVAWWARFKIKRLFTEHITLVKEFTWCNSAGDIFIARHVSWTRSVPKPLFFLKAKISMQICVDTFKRAIHKYHKRVLIFVFVWVVFFFFRVKLQSPLLTVQSLYVFRLCSWASARLFVVQLQTVMIRPCSRNNKQFMCVSCVG